MVRNLWPGISLIMFAPGKALLHPQLSGVQQVYNAMKSCVLMQLGSIAS